MSTFNIKIPCKKYVKAYLENNCGIPVDLNQLPKLKDMFISFLNKKPINSEPLYKTIRLDSVTIHIFLGWPHPYGYRLNKEDLFNFTQDIEQMVKYNMRQFIGLNRAIGIPYALCIREFQDKFGFPESIWSYQSIKKDFDRHGRIPELKSIKEMKVKMNIIFLDNLSDLGIISEKLKTVIYKNSKDVRN